MIVKLRPYMSAAACLVIIVAAVLAIGGRGETESASYTAMYDVPAAAAPMAPAIYSQENGPKEATAEDSVSFSYGITEAQYDMAPAEPVEAPLPKPYPAPAGDSVIGEVSANVTVTADRDIDLSEFETYVPGSTIDEAWMIFYHDESGLVENRVISDTAVLAALLADTPAEVAPEAIPQKAVALLRIYVGGIQQPVKLYFVGENVIAETSSGFYMAFGSAEEFSGIK